ncbi:MULTISPECIES: thioesterase II family protein [unclassified Streptomyces]|uniref:thioesterase II family protein n=1 Tax=unclassified Streptomyces TaxID=2593676 RepID=UPI001F0494BF|nr:MULTISPECIES: alpha/beta fold hydrolase [unclassified Streptomyces]MCH0564629.1 thioesterase [Streptomyces sp. MUM 2J]MCH0570329.1 thioesterase [Streptomyces sp. MUM 136J]
MRSPAEERWIRRLRDDGGCGTKLVCFPHAGGWASAYGGWPPRLPLGTGVLAVRYPGREDRLSDPFPSGLDALAEDIAEALQGLTGHRLVLFGHSMGASVAHEVALRLQKRGRPPAALCVSGRRPPHMLDGQRRLLGSDEEVIAGIVRLDESRAAVFAEPELRELLLPAICADYRLVDGYAGGHRPPLDCPVYAYAGQDDPEVAPEQMRGWADMTNAAFRLLVLPGGHFYLRAEESTLLADVTEVLRHVEDRMDEHS